MKKIRIGNDIRLNMTLKGVSDYDSASIKQLRCYFTKVSNQSGQEHLDYINRPQYAVGNYTLGTCGPNTYYAYPTNNGIFDPFHDDCSFHHDAHWFPGYNGFGIKSKSYCNPGLKFDYLAPSTVLEEKNRIACYFPAVEQRYLGVYKLTVVLVIYQQGWGSHNLRTYTIDYGEVFELVGDATGESGDIILDIDDVTPDTPDVPDDPDTPVTPTKNTFKAGYSMAETLEEYNRVTPGVMMEYEYVKGKKYLINNPKIGAYIWVITPKPIGNLIGQLLECPYKLMGAQNGEYYYRSTNPMIEGEDYIEVVY